MKKEDDGPALGEVRLGPECPNGHRTCVRRRDDGELEGGFVTRVAGKVGSTPPGDYPIVGTRGDGGFYIGRARSGPARVNSAAYQSGWDSIYGRYRGQPS